MLAVIRAARILWLLLIGAALTAASALMMVAGRRCAWWPGLVRWWHGRLCRVLGLQIIVHGSPASAVLMVANHVSWLDIPVLGGLAPVTFLSKSEVRGWPLLGWLSARTGVLFIERGGNQTGALSARIAATIQAGRTLVLFPEGTTGTGVGLRPFYPRLFAAAGEPGIRVQPVAVRYGSNAAPDPVAPFVGDDTLLAHLPRVLRLARLRVEVSFLPVIEPRHLDRRALAATARAAIADALGLATDASDASPPRPIPRHPRRPAVPG